MLGFAASAPAPASYPEACVQIPRTAFSPQSELVSLGKAVTTIRGMWAFRSSHWWLSYIGFNGPVNDSSTTSSSPGLHGSTCV